MNENAISIDELRARGIDGIPRWRTVGIAIDAGQLWDEAYPLHLPADDDSVAI